MEDCSRCGRKIYRLEHVHRASLADDQRVPDAMSLTGLTHPSCWILKGVSPSEEGGVVL